MICEHCAAGGDLMPEWRARIKLAQAGNRRSQLHANQASGMRRRINNSHGRCPGGTWCDCQHAGTPHHRRPAGQTH